MESGRPLRESHMTDEQQKVTRAFRLFTEKPRLVIVNTADDESQPERFTSFSTPEQPVLAVPAGLELELSKMSPTDRADFVAEMGITTTDRDHLIRTLLKASRQTTFFTAGEPESARGCCTKGARRLEAADGIHTDLARGFIRPEVMTVADLVRLGSERRSRPITCCGKSRRITSSRTTTFC